MKKVLLAVLLIAVVAIGYGVYRLSASLDSIVLAAIEKYGSEATGTRVEVAGVDIGLKQGRATVTGLVVGNPDGFEGDAFTLGEVTVDLDPGSVTKDPIVIDNVTIGAPAVAFIVRKDGSTNLDVIRKNLEAASAGSPDSGETGGGATRRIRIDRFVFADGLIHVDATAAGAEKPLEVKMPKMEITRVGGSEGAPPEEIARIIARAYSKRVAEVAARKGLEEAVKGLAGEAGDAVKKLFD